MTENVEKKPVRRARKSSHPVKRDVSTVDCSVFLESSYFKRKTICCGQILCANRMVIYDSKLIKPCEKHRIVSKIKATTKENSTPPASKSSEDDSEEAKEVKHKESVPMNEQKSGSNSDGSPTGKKDSAEPSLKKHSSGDNPKQKGNYEKVIILKRKLSDVPKTSNNKTAKTTNSQ